MSNSKSPIDWLKKYHSCDDQWDVYALDEIKKEFQVRDVVDGEAWLVLNPIEDHWLKFAVLDFHSSQLDGVETKATIVFHGEGTVNGLNECRHTWWGDDGYLFYPKAKNIVKALEALHEFFEMT